MTGWLSCFQGLVTFRFLEPPNTLEIYAPPQSWKPAVTLLSRTRSQSCLLSVREDAPLDLLPSDDVAPNGFCVVLLASGCDQRRVRPDAVPRGTRSARSGSVPLVHTY